LVKTAWKSVQ